MVSHEGMGLERTETTRRAHFYPFALPIRLYPSRARLGAFAALYPSHALPATHPKVLPVRALPAPRFYPSGALPMLYPFALYPFGSGWADSTHRAHLYPRAFYPSGRCEPLPIARSTHRARGFPRAEGWRYPCAACRPCGATRANLARLFGALSFSTVHLLTR